MTSLCVACCSTITKSGSDAYITSCCNKQICESCLQANPRLRHYSPCLACCGAVQVVQRSKLHEYTSPLIEQQKREDNTFVIGEDDDDQDSGETIDTSSGILKESKLSDLVSQMSVDASRVEEPVEGHSGPAKVWLKKGDTLHGIALRFKVDVGSFRSVTPCILNAFYLEQGSLQTQQFAAIYIVNHTSSTSHKSIYNSTPYH